MIAKGYVYILRNFSMPNLVKIGSTKKNPKSRAKELSSTGVPTPYIVYASFEIDGDFVKAEKAIHDHLKEYRLANNREFFKLDPDEAKKILSEFFCRKTTDEEHYENWKSQKEKDILEAKRSVDDIYSEILIIESKIRKNINLKALMQLYKPTFIAEICGVFYRNNDTVEWHELYDNWCKSNDQINSEFYSKCEVWQESLGRVDRNFNYGWRRSIYHGKNIRVKDKNIDTNKAYAKINELKKLVL